VSRPLLTATFGEDAGDHFNHGIDLAGAGQPVHPSLDGELVFRYEGAQDYSSVPRGTGAIVVLRHAQNLLSLYAHLAEGTLGPARTRYGPADVLGLTGETGRAEAPALSFSVYDAEALSWVNPLAFLPPIPDAQFPLIREVVRAVGDQRQALTNSAKVAAGGAGILVEAYDLREDVGFRWPLAPYALRLAVDGVEVTRISFDSLSLRGARMVLLPGGLARKDLYTGDGLLNLGTVDLHAGESRLRLSVRDFAGNETVREMSLAVSAPR
jgi:hypothetical protein